MRSSDFDKGGPLPSILTKPYAPYNGCSLCWTVHNPHRTRTVFQDDIVCCFVDSRAVYTYGHTVIAPTEHYPDLCAVPENTLSHLILTVQKLARHFRQKGLPIKDFTLRDSRDPGREPRLIHEVPVEHFHLHLIPRYEDPFFLDLTHDLEFVKQMIEVLRL
jgi:histidine triad (HIT) family protein